MQFTFKELLEKYNVVIPQLQRDYAQGRETEADLRKVFISNIKSVLSDEGEKLNLDFVYGYKEPAGGGREVFVPLDGQQRLTTLWLIHWYLSPRTEEVVDDESFCYLDSQTAEFLRNFTYQTRVSSKRFCECLINAPLDLKEDKKLSEKISDSPWYMASWSSDPTIKSMLIMLDSLEELIADRENSWMNLLSGRITFDYIDIKSEEFRLTDELYIKMNSRGKPLTEFENFKALFSGILAGKDTEYAASEKMFEGAALSYQDYFAFKIDGQWLDVFWSYRKAVGLSVDDCILNYLYFVSEFLYYRSFSNSIYDGIVPKRDIDFLSGVFSIKENIDFLFDSLDLLSEIESVPEFFNSLFADISTFDNYEKDYFLRCISNTSFDVKDKTILYSVLAYATKLEAEETDDNFKDYVRIVRNLLTAVRQPNPKKRIEYISNLRLPNVSDYCSFIDTFIEAVHTDNELSVYEILSKHRFSGFTSIAVEKHKGEAISGNADLKQAIHALEEHKHIKGNTVNFNFLSSDAKQKAEAFLNIWSAKTNKGDVVRAFLSSGDYSVKTHQNTQLGAAWYFGGKSNWSRVLTASEKEEKQKVSKVLDQFLESYIKAEGAVAAEKLQFIIREYPSDVRDWKYYFIKYAAFTDVDNEKPNLFSWKDDDFQINRLGNSGKQVLHSYHVNPYEAAVKNIFWNDSRVVLYHGRFTDLSSIMIAGTLRMTIKENGWNIDCPPVVNLQESFLNKYGIEPGKNKDLTMPLEHAGKDRIVSAEAFIKDLLSQAGL